MRSIVVLAVLATASFSCGGKAPTPATPVASQPIASSGPSTPADHAAEPNPARPKDIVQPVRIVKNDVEEGDEEGGVEGGVVGGVMGAPPPPPPRPVQLVPPTVLESLRIAGERLIVPDDATKREIMADGRDKLVGSFKVCIDLRGDVTTAALLKSTGYQAYDTKLGSTMRGWKYRPFMVNGQPVPVCTAVTFIYSQIQPAPPPKP